MTDYRRGLPFATIQKAVDTAASLDLGIFNVTINVAAGTYSESVNLKTLVGAGEVLIVGDESVPANVVVAPASGWAFAPASAIVGTYRLRGFRLSSVDGFCVDALGAGCAVYFRNIEFANGGAAHIKAERLGLVEAEGDYSIGRRRRSSLVVGQSGYRLRGVAHDHTWRDAEFLSHVRLRECGWIDYLRSEYVRRFCNRCALRLSGKQHYPVKRRGPSR